jgi:tetratricopeptide (TPR) repeat protein
MQSETENNSLDFDNFLTWLYVNRVKVGIVTGIVAVVIAGAAIISWKKKENEKNANAALSALPSLIGPSSRSEATPEGFQKVANEYPDTGAGQRAALIAAGVLFSEGKYADAEKAFTKFLNENEEKDLLAQAAVGVAASLEAQGKINEAIAKYQELISKYSGQNVVSPAKLTLARLLESQNKPDAALKLYEDLTRSQNPYDPWSAEAGERREILLQKFPNLKTAPAAATAPAGGIPVSTNKP